MNGTSDFCAIESVSVLCVVDDGQAADNSKSLSNGLLNDVLYSHIASNTVVTPDEPDVPDEPEPPEVPEAPPILKLT